VIPVAISTQVFCWHPSLSVSRAMAMQAKHKGIVLYLKAEMTAFAASLEGDDSDKPIPLPVECIMCGRTCDRKFNMVRHCKTHIIGKLATMLTGLETSSRVRHPIFMEVVRALYDHDVMVGNELGGYAARAKAILAASTSYSGTSGDTGSLFTHMGLRDSNLVLVFDESGPEFWLGSDRRLPRARAVRSDLFYTRGFANLYLRHLLKEGGVYTRALRAIRAAWLQDGCEVTMLMNRRTETIAGLTCDLMESSGMVDLRGLKQRELVKMGEYECISIDATYKLALKVIGQDRNQKHNWTSIVGIRGSPLGLVAAHGEAPSSLKAVLLKALPADGLHQVEHVASDVCSGKLFDTLYEIFPNLSTLSLDPMHLCFRVDSFTKMQRVRPTVVGLVMRSIMGKFCIRDEEACHDDPYCGERLPKLTATERKMVDHIKKGDLTHRKAKDTLTSMDPNAPMQSLLEFASLLAAVAKVYPERMDLKSDKTTLRQVLVSACDPGRFGWYLNNIKYRSQLPKATDEYHGTGTTRNEQMHSMLNSNFKSIISVSKRMLTGELDTWLTAEMLVWLRAASRKLTRKVQRSDILAFVATSTVVFTSAKWDAFIGHERHAWVISGARSATRGSTKRKGPTSEQSEIYESIRGKTAKRSCRSVYQAR
jgi:hypothetical protein